MTSMLLYPVVRVNVWRGDAVMRGDWTATVGNGHVCDGGLELSCRVSSKKDRYGRFNTLGYIVAATRSLL
jgi:hypothetical protein